MNDVIGSELPLVQYKLSNSHLFVIEEFKKELIESKISSDQKDLIVNTFEKISNYETLTSIEINRVISWLGSGLPFNSYYNTLLIELIEYIISDYKLNVKPYIISNGPVYPDVNF